MQTIGYVTQQEADVYVATHFLTTDKLRVSWEALVPADKDVLLLKSFQAIELLPFHGARTSPTQPNAFPRCCNTTVPTAIKDSQVENAVALGSGDASEEANYYETLWKFGVESYSIGNLSESSSNGSWGRNPITASGVVSMQAAKLLKPFLNGGYRIE